MQVCLAYTVPETEQDIQDWLSDVIHVHSSTEKRDFKSFYRASSNTKRVSVNSLQVHFWEADVERNLPAKLIVEQSHVISDGIGVLTTFDELVSFLALTLADSAPSQIKWGLEVTRLPASLQDAIAHPPENWTVTKKETKQIERDNRARMSGKPRKPTTVDKVADRVLEWTLANNASSYKIRRALNKPLASDACRVAQSGEMFPLGLRPIAKKPYHGPWTSSDFLEHNLDKADTTKLLKTLKRHGVTLAPFIEAAMALATTWARRQRGLTPAPNKWDSASKVIGSFSNAVSKRSELIQDSQRYLGLTMGGIVTKISSSQARWSKESLITAVPWSLNTADRVPLSLEKEDTDSLYDISRSLAVQYKVGKEDPNWLRYSQATTLSTMQSEYLLLSDEAFYPYHPWLSSVGRLDEHVNSLRPLPLNQSFLGQDFDSASKTSAQLQNGSG